MAKLIPVLTNAAMALPAINLKYQSKK